MSPASITGTVSILGDHVSADMLLPARYSFLSPAEMAGHVLEDVGPEANARARTHAILVAGEAFGYGTGREAPARALKAAGIKAVIAASFARMFYRNAVNNGIIALECADLVRSGIAEGDLIDIDVEASVIRWSGRSFTVTPVPSLIREIVAAGDLIEYGRRRLAAARAAPR